MNSADVGLLRQTADNRYRRVLSAFLRRVFAELHPGGRTNFIPNWHVDAMCAELERLRAGDNDRLVINVPPRSLKSITTSVAFPAFLLGHDPTIKIIVASYGHDLARKHTSDCRRVMESDWYRRIFPGTRLAARGNTQDEIKTTMGGGRNAVSVGGAVTGQGCDYLVIDDLLKASDAASETELLRAQEYIEASLLSRFNNPGAGRVVAICQRLHEIDPAGYLLEKGTYDHLNLPAIAEQEETIDIGQGRVHRRRPGDVLCEQRFGRDALERLRREMGTATFNMQYQQNPIAPDGSPLRWEWFETYDEAWPLDTYQLIVQSWDTGMSSDPRSDSSVCTTWAFDTDVWHLLDVFRDRLDYPDLKRAVLRLSDEWRADRVLIEDAATGRPLYQECRQTNRTRFMRIRPEQDKEVRFRAACAPVEDGWVFLPREAAWLAEFKRELQGFPRSRNDDQVDSFSQFLNWSKGPGFWRALGREHPLRQERLQRQRRRRR